MWGDGRLGYCTCCHYNSVCGASVEGQSPEPRRLILQRCLVDGRKKHGLLHDRQISKLIYTLIYCMPIVAEGGTLCL